MTRPTLALALAAVLALGLAPSAPAADVAPEARRLLDEVARAYKALPSYADKGEVTLTFATEAGRPPVRQATPASVALARPNKVAIDAGIVRLVSDGKTLRTITPPFSMYRDAPATARVTLDDFADGPLGAVELGSPQGRPLRLVLAFLLGDDPVKGLVDDARSVRLKGGSEVIYEPQVGPTLAISIDPTTRLIARVAIDLAAKDGTGPLVPGSPLTLDSLAWVAGPILTKDVPDSTFALVKPEGYAEIAKLAKDSGKAKAQNERIGKAAPDFSLNVLDGPGKTRRVRKADLVGKVVLLDFWATWCAPCLAELPDVASMIAGAAKGGKPLAVVAVSIDQMEEGDIAEVRALVEKTLKAKKIELEVKPVGLVALDPSGTAAKAYGAVAIPFLVVIDAKGVVRHVHIGLTEKDVLMAEVEALLGPASKP